MSAYARVKRGKRADLGDIVWRSSWEANYCRILEHRKAKGEILDWAYEPQRFLFAGVLRGVTSYLPDFRVTYPDGTVEWVEIKGWEKPKDRTRWRRMKEQYPAVKLTIIGADLYKSLQNRFGGLENWEH